MPTPINRYQIPSPAETVDTLARSMRFKKPPAASREMAGAYPVAPEETAALVKFYGAIAQREVRQAILDVLAAAAAAAQVA